MFTIIGDDGLMPKPDFKAIVVNARTGYARQNSSWVIGRLLRDHWYWQHQDVEVASAAVDQIATQRHKTAVAQFRGGLRIAMYYADPGDGRPCYGLMTCFGCIVAALQFGIAVIPVVLYGEWLSLLASLMGTLMAFMTGALPVWHEEKLACRKGSSKVIIITAGNGAYDTIAIIGRGGLDMEDLAACGSRPSRQKTTTKVIFSALAFGWLVLLISVAGYQEHTWYLLGPGIIGMVHNVMAASAPRGPSSYGINLKYQTTIADCKVMKVLAWAEETHARLGLSLLPVFFPGPLRPREIDFWEYARRRADAYEFARQSDPAAKICPLPSLSGSDAIPKTELLST